MIEALFFYLFAGVMLASSVMVVVSRNPVYSVLFLILAFFNAAGLFVLVGAEFLAMLLVVVYVGAVAVTIPIIFVAYFQWGTSSEFWYVLIVHILIQVIDGNVIVPILFSDAVNLHPLAILISILFFGTIWGLWGVFFAIPLAVLLNTLLNSCPLLV